MRKTKIICTLGPNCDNRDVFVKLATMMDVARFNFSHGSYEEHKGRLVNLQNIRKEVGRNIPALLDTKGPEIRTGELVDHKKVTLVDGEEFILTVDEILGDSSKVYINYEKLIDDIEVGNHILIDDGLIELKVISIQNKNIKCKILSGGELGEKKGVNVPNVKINLPDLTDKDIEDIKFGIREDFDIIAASFVRSASCIKKIRSILDEHNKKMLIIAKIENHEGLSNIDEIIDEADGIMIARGDLGVEVDPTELPWLQKEIIKKCNAKGKIVVTATQMLDSMIRNVRPTRAEVTDVANAIYDGTDVVMLSGETANGKHPIEAVEIMSKICEMTEKNIDYNDRREKLFQTKVDKTITNTICKEAVYTAEILKVKSIVAPTETGNTARVLSKFKPKIPVYALARDDSVVRKMMIYFGVTPIKVEDRDENTDLMLSKSIEILKNKKMLDEGDLIVLTFGVHKKGNTTHTNAIRVETV